jgi:hypothetical protein
MNEELDPLVRRLNFFECNGSARQGNNNNNRPSKPLMQWPLANGCARSHRPADARPATPSTPVEAQVQTRVLAGQVHQTRLIARSPLCCSHAV